MGSQRQTLIPSRLEYITLLSHQTNNTELKSTIGFNEPETYTSPIFHYSIQYPKEWSI